MSPRSSGLATFRSKGRCVFSIGTPAVRRLRGRQDQLVDLLQHARLHLRLEVRGGGELVLQGLAQEMLHGPGQVRGHRRLRGEARQERGKVLVEVHVVRRVERALDEGLQPVGRVQMVSAPAAAACSAGSPGATWPPAGPVARGGWRTGANRSPVRMCSRITSIPRSFWASMLRNEGIQHRVLAPSGCDC